MDAILTPDAEVATEAPLAKEFAVFGEKHDKTTVCIARGFATHEAASDTRIVMKEWHRVWVRQVAGKASPSRPQGRPRQHHETVFKMVEEAAATGKRCPTNYEWPVNAKRLRDLEKEGKLRTVIYGRYWRVAEILVGPHAGKKTAMPSHGGMPYVLSQKGRAAEIFADV